MADDMILTERYRDALASYRGISDMKMMGGRCFFHNGNMIGGCHREKDGRGIFMFRVGTDRNEEALAKPHAIPMPMGARTMRGIIAVMEDDMSDTALKDWVAYTMVYTLSLPPKAKSGPAHKPMKA